MTPTGISGISGLPSSGPMTPTNSNTPIATRQPLTQPLTQQLIDQVSFVLLHFYSFFHPSSHPSSRPFPHFFLPCSEVCAPLFTPPSFSPTLPHSPRSPPPLYFRLRSRLIQDISVSYFRTSSQAPSVTEPSPRSLDNPFFPFPPHHFPPPAPPPALASSHKLFPFDRTS